jgi:hypothetical protein
MSTQPNTALADSDRINSVHVTTVVLTNSRLDWSANIPAVMLLPTAEKTDPEALPGEVVRQRMSTTRRRILDALTTMGRRAAERYQQ